LKPLPKEEEQTPGFEKPDDTTFDPNNAYMDLSNSKYQEHLISKIVDDPKIDK
jgi:hypothetical protein